MEQTFRVWICGCSVAFLANGAGVVVVRFCREEVHKQHNNRDESPQYACRAPAIEPDGKASLFEATVATTAATANARNHNGNLATITSDYNNKDND